MDSTAPSTPAALPSMTPAQEKRQLNAAFDRVSEGSRKYLVNLALTLAAAEFKPCALTA